MSTSISGPLGRWGDNLTKSQYIEKQAPLPDAKPWIKRIERNLFPELSLVYQICPSPPVCVLEACVDVDKKFLNACIEFWCVWVNLEAQQSKDAGHILAYTFLRNAKSTWAVSKL